MAYGKKVVTSQFRPFESIHVQHFAEFFRAERQEWVEGDGKVGNQLQGNVEDGSYTFHICLSQFPRFGVGQVFVSDTCQIHGLFLCIAEFEYVEQFFYFCFHVCEFFQRFLVVVGQFALCRYAPVEVFLSQHHCTVYEVAVYGYQFVVIACLEVFPGEVVIFRFRCIGGQYVAEYVLFAWEVSQIFVQPYGPVAGSGDFVSFEVEEFVARHVVRQDIAAFCFQHGREYDAVEHDVVFSNEMDQAGFGIFPPSFPAVGE